LLFDPVYQAGDSNPMAQTRQGPARDGARPGISSFDVPANTEIAADRQLLSHLAAKLATHKLTVALGSTQ
jgi:hypothetical protein